MHFKKFFIITLVLTFQFFFSESKTETVKFFVGINSDSSKSINEVIEFIQSVFPGEIIKLEKKFKKDNLIWEVNLITTEGGSIRSEISFKGNRLLSIIADEGPFEYEISPYKDMKSFLTVKETAESKTSQKVLKWNFIIVKEKFEYNFWLFTKSGRAQLRIDAESGETISKNKNKKKAVK